MTVVYVLGTGSKWKNYELLYSLRSIEKNLKGFTDVVIVGELPSWIQNVIHIPLTSSVLIQTFPIICDARLSTVGLMMGIAVKGLAASQTAIASFHYLEV